MANGAARFDSVMAIKNTHANTEICDTTKRIQKVPRRLGEGIPPSITYPHPGAAHVCGIAMDHSPHGDDEIVAYHAASAVGI